MTVTDVVVKLVKLRSARHNFTCVQNLLNVLVQKCVFLKNRFAVFLTSVPFRLRTVV